MINAVMVAGSGGRIVIGGRSIAINFILSEVEIVKDILIVTGHALVETEDNVLSAEGSYSAEINNNILYVTKEEQL